MKKGIHFGRKTCRYETNTSTVTPPPPKKHRVCSPIFKVSPCPLCHDWINDRD